MSRRDSDLEVALARSKSFTGKAVLAFLLYLLFWLPGFIANVMFCREAQAAERLAGQRLPGTGCLTFLLCLNLIPLAIVFFAVCAAVISDSGG